MCALLIRKTALSIKEPVMELEGFLYQGLILIGVLIVAYLIRVLLKWLGKKLAVMPMIKKFWRNAFSV